MVRKSSFVIGLGLALLWAIGLGLNGHATMLWFNAVAAIVAFGIAGLVDERTTGPHPRPRPRPGLIAAPGREGARYMWNAAPKDSVRKSAPPFLPARLSNANCARTSTMLLISYVAPRPIGI